MNKTNPMVGPALAMLAAQNLSGLSVENTSDKQAEYEMFKELFKNQSRFPRKSSEYELAQEKEALKRKRKRKLQREARKKNRKK